jgi:hypothetical protein
MTHGVAATGPPSPAPEVSDLAGVLTAAESPGSITHKMVHLGEKSQNGRFSGCQTPPARSYFRPARKGDPHVRPDSSVGRAAD